MQHASNAKMMGEATLEALQRQALAQQHAVLHYMRGVQLRLLLSSSALSRSYAQGNCKVSAHLQPCNAQNACRLHLAHESGGPQRAARNLRQPRQHLPEHAATGGCMEAICRPSTRRTLITFIIKTAGGLPAREWLHNANGALSLATGACLI
jgi:hypothetical protein